MDTKVEQVKQHLNIIRGYDTRGENLANNDDVIASDFIAQLEAVETVKKLDSKIASVRLPMSPTKRRLEATKKDLMTTLLQNREEGIVDFSYDRSRKEIRYFSDLGGRGVEVKDGTLELSGFWHDPKRAEENIKRAAKVYGVNLFATKEETIARMREAIENTREASTYVDYLP